MAVTGQDWSKDLASHLLPALGFIELSSISRGLFLTDTVLKKAPIKVIASQPISGGNHVLLFFGDVAAVEESHQAAIELSDGCLLKEILIPAVHEGLVPYLDSLWEFEGNTRTAQDSVGIVESETLAGAILSADSALKAANTYLCRMRLGQGIGGKAYFVLAGKLDEVEASIDAAKNRLKEMESLARVDVIPQPQEEAFNYF